MTPEQHIAAYKAMRVAQIAERRAKIQALLPNINVNDLATLSWGSGDILKEWEALKAVKASLDARRK